ncbi:hypothetical protein DIPPA_60276 [Diplonema papillatum]|nr:hypothetical protein DIPPA_60276 [Diplonema papillatum]
MSETGAEDDRPLDDSLHGKLVQPLESKDATWVKQKQQENTPLNRKQSKRDKDKLLDRLYGETYRKQQEALDLQDTPLKQLERGWRIAGLGLEESPRLLTPRLNLGGTTPRGSQTGCSPRTQISPRPQSTSPTGKGFVISLEGMQLSDSTPASGSLTARRASGPSRLSATRCDGTVPIIQRQRRHSHINKSGSEKLLPLPKFERSIRLEEPRAASDGRAPASIQPESPSPPAPPTPTPPAAPAPASPIYDEHTPSSSVSEVVSAARPTTSTSTPPSTLATVPTSTTLVIPEIAVSKQVVSPSLNLTPCQTSPTRGATGKKSLPRSPKTQPMHKLKSAEAHSRREALKLSPHTANTSRKSQERSASLDSASSVSTTSSIEMATIGLSPEERERLIYLRQLQQQQEKGDTVVAPPSPERKEKKKAVKAADEPDAMSDDDLDTESEDEEQKRRDEEERERLAAEVHRRSLQIDINTPQPLR